MSMRTIQCPNCKRKFGDNSAALQHIKAVHGGKGAAAFRAENRDDYEESFAERAIRADLDHAMGIENDDYDWLIAPFK